MPAAAWWPCLWLCLCAAQARIEEVTRALVTAGLPFGAKAASPKAISEFPFHNDPKPCKTFWDVRKVRLRGVGLHAFKGARGGALWMGVHIAA